jgi:hypothetical protein
MGSGYVFMNSWLKIVVNSDGTLAIPVLSVLWYCGCDVAGGQAVMIWGSYTVRSSFLTSTDIMPLSVSMYQDFTDISSF